MSETRVVLKEDVGEVEMNRLAAREGWIFGGEIDRTDETPFERFWHTPDGAASLHYVEDWIIGLVYVVVDAPDPAPLAEAVRAALDGLSLADALRMWGRARTLEEKADALYHVGAMAPAAFDAEVFAAFERAFKDADPEVRRAAVLAAFYTRWPQFEAPLQRMAFDADERLSRYARVTLEQLRAHHWPAR
ncbi:MAG TPA: hypothetical protein VFY65_16050 [Longimicrobium sp.]|nr:hypothetical protein [Longimicrobium sp.]